MLLLDNIHLINRSMRVSNLHGNRMKIRVCMCVSSNDLSFSTCR